MNTRFSKLILWACAVLNWPYLASGSILDLDEGFRAPTFGETNPASRTLLLPDGKFLLFFNIDTVAGRQTGAITRYFADGSLDPSFNFSRDYEFVNAAGFGPDGKLYIAAQQTIYGQRQPVITILRLDTDGSIDGAPLGVLDYGPFGSPFVHSIVFQPDGKILIAGLFSAFNGVSRSCILRLFPGGELDPAFNPPLIDNAVAGIYAKPVVLADGKILIAGDFATVAGNFNQGAIARLNADGSHDTTFVASGFARSSNYPNRGLLVEAGGKIILGGRFQFGSGPSVTRPPLIRLEPNGAWDPTFVRVTSITPFPTLRDLAKQADGKLIAAIPNSVYRFNVDGSRDTTFHEPVLTNDTLQGRLPGSAFSLFVQPDGRLLTAGAFTDVDLPTGSGPVSANFSVARLNADGTLDPTLTTPERTGREVAPNSFDRGADGSTLVTIAAASYPTHPSVPFGVGKLGVDAALDATFSITAAEPSGFLSLGFVGQGFRLLADGKIFLHGYGPPAFGSLHGRITRDGAEDATYFSDPAAPLFFQDAVAMPDGRILLVAGTDAQSTAEGTLTALQRNGGVDLSFVPPIEIREHQVEREQGTGTIIRMWVGSRVLAVQPDGKIIFQYLKRGPEVELLRLNPDGSRDATFAPMNFPVTLTENYPLIYDRQTNSYYQPIEGVFSAALPLRDAVVQSDGRIIIAGNVPGGIMRLNTNGTADSSFSAGSGPQWTVTTPTSTFQPIVERVALQNDGKPLLVGNFEAFNGVTAPGMIGLLTNGMIDPGFAAPVARVRFSALPTSFERQADGSFLLSGAYRFPSENEPSFIRIDQIGGVPIVGSHGLASALTGRPFTYQIVASGQPTSYGATGLPPSFSLNSGTGLISGTPTSGEIGTYVINLTATNAEGTSAPRSLTLTIAAAPAAVPVVSVVSRKLHGAQNFDIALPPSGNPGVESRAGGANGEHTLVVTFANPISSIGARRIVSGIGEIASSAIGSDPHEYTLNLRGVTDAQEIVVALDNVTDSAGNNSPTISARMAVLLGDVNGSRSVNASDVGQAKAFVGQTLTTTNFRADVSANGSINASDVAQVKSRAGTSLPAGATPERAGK